MKANPKHRLLDEILSDDPLDQLRAASLQQGLQVLDSPINMGYSADMKTTLEMPDSIFRRAKATAARKGQSLAAFVTAAVEAKLASDTTAAKEKPWMRSAGVFRGQREESRRILRRVEEECGRIRPEDWE